MAAGDTTIRITATAGDAQREFAAIDRAIDRMGTSALAAGDKLQRAFSQMARSARQARIDLASLNGGGNSRAQDSFLGNVGANIITRAAGLGLDALQTGASQAIDLSRANVALAQSAKEAGTTLGAQKEQAAALADQLKINIVDATALTAQTTRLAVAAGIGADKADELGVALANALAASGRPLDELPERLRQLATGQDELFDVLGPVKIGGTSAASPEAIYKATAAQKGLNRELTDSEKLLARIDAVMRKGAEASGAATDRVRTLAGQWDVFRNSVTEIVSSPFAEQGLVTLLFGLGDRDAASLGVAVVEAQRYADELARIDAFRRSIGTSAFSAIGTERGATDAQRAKYDEWNQRGRRLDLDARERINEFERQQAEALPSRIRTLEGQREQARRNIYSTAGNLADLEARRAGLDGRETGEQLRNRIFRTANELTGSLDARAGAQYTIAALGGYNGASLSREARDRLRAAYDTEIRESKKDLKEEKERLKRLDENLAALRQKLVGANPLDPDERPLTQVVIENRDPLAIARIAQVTVDGETFEF